MNGTHVQSAHAPAREWNLTRAAGGSITEAIGALGAVVLAVIGLAGLVPNLMASVATIIVGAAILLEGIAYTQLPSGSRWVQSRGFSAELLGGLAGIVLGILALFGTYPETLLAVALIVFGAALLLSTIEFSQRQRFASLQTGEVVQETQTFTFVSGGQLMLGLGAVVLGILAVIGLSPMTLILVGVLGLGFSALWNTIEAGGLMMQWMQGR